MKRGRLFICLSVLMGTAGCLFEDDLRLPSADEGETSLHSNADLIAIRDALEQSGEDIYTFGSGDNSIVEAFVISSDQGGNFYKTMIVQDRPQNPEFGIGIRLEMRAYYTRYNLGRRVFLKLSGLSVGREKGSYYLGYQKDGKVGNIPSPLIDTFIFRSPETVEIMPEPIELEDVSERRIHTLVSMENIQFALRELGKSFAGEPFDMFNGDRVLEQCDNQMKIGLLTSTYAGFRLNRLPEKRLKIEAVLTRDYYSERFGLVLSSPAQIDEMAGERCDPDFYRCDLVSDSGDEVLFHENFEEIKTTADLEESGWFNLNLNLGNGKFKKRSSMENSFLRISAYNTGENAMEAWLISPEIDLGFTEGERLSFRSRATFDDGEILTAWITRNYQDDPGASSWEQLDLKVSNGSRDGSNEEFIHSGWADLSCLEGKIRIGFKYLGADPGYTTTYDIDDILVHASARSVAEEGL